MHDHTVRVGHFQDPFIEQDAKDSALFPSEHLVPVSATKRGPIQRTCKKSAAKHGHQETLSVAKPRAGVASQQTAHNFQIMLCYQLLPHFVRLDICTTLDRHVMKNSAIQARPEEASLQSLKMGRQRPAKESWQADKSSVERQWHCAPGTDQT